MMTAEIKPRTRPRVSTRLTGLDGLRGVAAVVVVLHHLYLVSTPALIAAGGSGLWSVYWWLSETPLKLLSAGTEAVLVFFVLSGLVVALPVLGRQRFSWSGFFSGRLVRLYLPVWASIAVGTALVWLLPRHESAVTNGAWVDRSNATSITVNSFLAQASLTRASYDINNVLWSLRWELVFSALLPLFVAVAILAHRHWTITIGIAFALSTVGALSDIDAFKYLPVFFIGTLIAVRLESMREWMRRRRLRPRAAGWGAVLVLGSLFLIVAPWMLRPIAPTGSIGSTLLGQLSVLGALGLVVSAIGVRPVRAALDSRAGQWLGRVSFSLYLVHVPIIATLTFLMGDDQWWLVALLSIPSAFLAAWGFHWAVERPSHRLARWLSHTVTGGIDNYRSRSAVATPIAR